MTMRGTATAIVEARLKAGACPNFPGLLPVTLDDAYAIQKEAIALWPDDIAGWKVGRLTSDLAERFGQERFIGPVFRASVHYAEVVQPIAYPAFPGGSAMFEAEYVIYAGLDDNGSVVPARATTGIEVAASPIANLPGLTSLATIADLGNNAGQIIGAPVPLDRLYVPSSLACETRVGTDEPVMRAADCLPGGPITAFRFAVEEAQRIGFPLQPGQFVTTGAVTGMNPVRKDQNCIANFGEFGLIECVVTARLAVRS